MFWQVPNLRGFHVKDLGWDLTLAKYGFRRKLRELIFVKMNENDKMNRYLRRQLTRLRMKSRNPKEFWELGMILLKRSKSLRMTALHQLWPNWHKTMPARKVVGMFATLDQICRGDAHFPTCQEFVLPKPDGGARVITAPKAAWRLYAWMVNSLLAVYYETRLSPHQHGHRKGMGLGTAWHEVINRVLPCKYIYEFDLKKFHDALERNFIAECLAKDGLPQQVITLIDRLNRCRKRDRSKRSWLYQQNGVPQGLNTSAILGMIALEHLNLYNHITYKYIGYADDGVVGSDTPGTEEWLREALKTGKSGAQLKTSGSRYVKENGEWKGSLKFLGLRMDGSRLFAATHSGNTKEFKWEEISQMNPKELTEVIRQEGLHPGWYPPKGTLDWRAGKENVKIFSFLLSKLFENGEKSPNRELHWTDRSVLSVMKGVTGNLTTASSYAFRWLKIELRSAGYRELLNRKHSRTERYGEPRRILRFSTLNEYYVLNSEPIPTTDFYSGDGYECQTEKGTEWIPLN